MAHWAVVFPAERLNEERLIAHDSLPLPAEGPAPGDVVLLIADSELFGIGGSARRARCTTRTA